MICRLYICILSSATTRGRDKTAQPIWVASESKKLLTQNIHQHVWLISWLEFISGIARGRLEDEKERERGRERERERERERGRERGGERGREGERE